MLFDLCHICTNTQASTSFKVRTNATSCPKNFMICSSPRPIQNQKILSSPSKLPKFPLFPQHLFHSHLLLLMCRLCLILDYNTPKDKIPLLDLFILHNTVNKQTYKQHVLNKNLVKKTHYFILHEKIKNLHLSKI